MSQEVTKILDIAKAELAKKDDQKALDALTEKVEAAAHVATNDLFKQKLTVRGCEKHYAEVVRNVSSSLLTITNAEIELESQRALLSKMEAINTARF